jgi:hypothetical protein
MQGILVDLHQRPILLHFARTFHAAIVASLEKYAWISILCAKTVTESSAPGSIKYTSQQSDSYRREFLKSLDDFQVHAQINVDLRELIEYESTCLQSGVRFAIRMLKG